MEPAWPKACFGAAGRFESAALRAAKTETSTPAGADEPPGGFKFKLARRAGI